MMNTPLLLPACADPGIPVPDYVPAGIADRLAGQNFAYKLSAVVKAALRTPKKITVTEHAEKYRVVTEPPHTGPWRRYHAPHSVKIMDTFGLAHVREIWFCAPEQAGKTSTMLNCLHWGAHISPGDIFFLLPDDKSARKTIAEKIRPLIEQSKALAEIMTGKEKDNTLNKIKLGNGVRIFPAWATSPSSMASFPARYAFGDEVDKGAELSGRETDRITLIKKRLRLFGKRAKGFFCSTPAGLFIYKGVYDCPQVWELRPVCQGCGKVEIWDESRFVDIATAMVSEIEGGVFKVEYICGHCGDIWNDKKRESALRPGRWVCVKGDHLTKPARIGFHMDAFSCIDIPMAEIAVAYIKSQAGGVVDKIAYANGYRCKNYEYEEADHEEDYILRLVDPGHEKGICPDNPSAVLLIADTQQVGFWFQVFALGWGADFDPTVIDYGYVKDFDGLVAIQNKTYASSSGKLYQAESGWIDSGGGLDKDRKKHTRPVQVINFCKDMRFWVNRQPFWHPLKGWGPRELAWDQSKIEFYPSSVGKKVPIPGGLILTRINANLWKDELDRRLRIDPGEPGAIRLPVFRDAEGAESEAEAKRYAKQLCAWYRKENGIWKAVAGRDDHYGDIWGYMFAIADMIGIRDRKKPVEKSENEQRECSSITVLSGGVDR
jgi:hypothetical protein